LFKEYCRLIPSLCASGPSHWLPFPCKPYNISKEIVPPKLKSKFDVDKLDNVLAVGAEIQMYGELLGLPAHVEFNVVVPIVVHPMGIELELKFAVYKWLLKFGEA
jgi:hypothetical protein